MKQFQSKKKVQSLRQKNKNSKIKFKLRNEFKSSFQENDLAFRSSNNNSPQDIKSLQSIDSIIIRPENNFEDHPVTTLSSIKEAVINEFTNEGLISYLQSKVGGQRNERSINQLIQRLVLFLSWASSLLRMSSLILTSVMKHFKLILEHYELVEKFVEYLDKRKELSTSSQLNYLFDISKTVQWFYLFKQSSRNNTDSNQYTEDSLMLQRWLSCVKNIQKVLNKSLSQDQARSNSLETCIYNAEYPEGGMKQLQECIMEDIEFIKSYDGDETFIDKHSFIRFMRILYSSIYVYGVQGRLAGNLTSLHIFYK